MAKKQESHAKVELDPGKLLGFSQLLAVSYDARRNADALFNKRGGEPASPSAQQDIDSLLNKRGTEPSAPTLQRAADSLVDKRGNEFEMPPRRGK